MKVLIAIDAPGYGRQGEFDRRAAQFEQNELSRMIQLLAVRIGMATPSGEIASQDGKAVLRWKTEIEPAKPADEAA